MSLAREDVINDIYYPRWNQFPFLAVEGNFDR